MRFFSRTAVAAMLTMVAASGHGADIAELVANCDDCHGENGVSRWTDMPTIAGIDAFVHSDALWVYQAGERPCASGPYRRGDLARAETTMCEVVKDLSDDQIEAVADYYAALPFVAAAQPFDPELAKRGQAIHESDCRRCHSDGGSNPEDEASILAGQHMGYLRTTFAQYAEGQRSQPSKMQEKMDALSSDDVTALLHYYASQQ